VVQMREIVNACRICERNPLEEVKMKQEDGIRLDLKETGGEGVN